MPTASVASSAMRCGSIRGRIQRHQRQRRLAIDHGLHHAPHPQTQLLHAARIARLEHAQQFGRVAYGFRIALAHRFQRRAVLLYLVDLRDLLRLERRDAFGDALFFIRRSLRRLDLPDAGVDRSRSTYSLVSRPLRMIASSSSEVMRNMRRTKG